MWKCSSFTSDMSLNNCSRLHILQLYVHQICFLMIICLNIRYIFWAKIPVIQNTNYRKTKRRPWKMSIVHAINTFNVFRHITTAFLQYDLWLLKSLIHWLAFTEIFEHEHVASVMSCYALMNYIGRQGVLHNKCLEDIGKTTAKLRNMLNKTTTFCLGHNVSHLYMSEVGTSKFGLFVLWVDSILSVCTFKPWCYISDLQNTTFLCSFNVIFFREVFSIAN